jgi:hypothetical protein
MRNRVLTLAAAVLLPLAAASAQQVAAPTAPAAPHNVISIQPLNAVFTAYSAEFEHQTGAAVTLGVGGTYVNAGDGIDEITYKSGDLKLRYYPNGTALMGFSFGGSAGFSSVSGTDVSGAKTSVSGPSLGVLLEYQWLLGVQHNFAVALGLGAKAVFVKDNQFTSDNFVTRYPTARVSVGYAF